MLRMALILANNQKHSDKAIDLRQAAGGDESHRSGA